MISIEEMIGNDVLLRKAEVARHSDLLQNLLVGVRKIRRSLSRVRILRRTMIFADVICGTYIGVTQVSGGA